MFGSLALNNGKTIAVKLLKFSLPLILSSILQQLYIWADALIVGNAEGEIALAAIGVTTAVINFYLMIIFGFTTGLNILFAQNYGSGNNDDNKKLLATYSLCFLLVFTLLAVIGIVLAKPILELLHTTPETLNQAESYLKTILPGIPFLAVYNVYSAALRGIGNTKTPFVSIIISSVINIVLDIVLVIWLHKGVEGAAVATVISQIIMTIYLLAYTQKKQYLLRIISIRRLLDKHALKNGMLFGLPPMIQSGVTAGGNLVLQNFMNGFGTSTVAAITTAYRIDSIILQPIISFASAISTITAQSHGANDNNKTKLIFSVGTIIMAFISVIMSVFVIVFGGYLIALFGIGAEATAIGKAFFIRIGAFYLIFGLASAIRGYLEGMGDLTYSGAAGIVSLLVRIGSSYIFMGIWNNMVIAYAEAISWGALFLLYILRAKYKKFTFLNTVKK